MTRTTGQRPVLIRQERSARSWARIELWSWVLVLWVAALGFGLAYLNAPTLLSGILSLITSGLIVALLITRSWAVSKGRTAQTRERAAGYTTLFRGGEDLWQLDSATGDPIRPPRIAP